MKEPNPTYTVRDMAKMFRRLDELTRATKELGNQLRIANNEVQRLKEENAELESQLLDMQGDFIRERTSAVVLPMLSDKCQ